MPENLARKILKAHLAEGRLVPGEEIGIRIDHTLLQDATGTMAMLQFEALGLDSVRAPLSVQYVDHNIIQTDARNADDHAYLRTACARYGIHYSPPGNGVSHQVHMERFGEPGKTLLGSDSHTPGAAGVSMLGIGAGGLDVALAMAGRPFYLPCPRVFGVHLTGALPDWVSAKDVILEMLRRHTVKGGVGKVVEYYGPGVASLSATDRETIGNMGAELGATSSIFPSDERTREYLDAKGRGEVFAPLSPDPGCDYDDHDEIDLSRLEPLIACPTSPGNVVPIREVAGIEVHQVIVGSSVNSSFRDLMAAAKIVEGRRVAPGLSFNINPGSREVLENVAAEGGVLALLRAGARIHEPGCLGCIGMGQAPGTGQVSLRTFPRNFPGRSGTKDDRVYLCSPETAAASALRGVITDPRDLSRDMPCPRIRDPEKYLADTGAIIHPTPELRKTEIVRGPNIHPIPHFDPLPETLTATVAIVLGDNITTDAIMPAGARVLPYRSNIDAISEFVFSQLDPDFPAHARALGNAAVAAGENYGQGSSREHAALAPRFLGVRVKIVKSFARIHKANLCNNGILPLTFANPEDAARLVKGARLTLHDIRDRVARGEKDIPVEVDGRTVMTRLDVSERDRLHILAGGTLNAVREEMERE